MAKFDGIVGKALPTVTEKENELTLVFADNRYLFVTLENGKLKSDSVRARRQQVPVHQNGEWEAKNRQRA